MKIVREDLPTEGVTIAGIRFLPGKAEDVDAKLAKELTERKGFVFAVAPKKEKRRTDK